MLKMLLASLQANAQAQATAAQPNPVMQFVPLIIVFVIFYFFMIRPQKKKMDEEQKLLSALQKGDDIYTKSGVLGRIYGMTEKVVTLELEDGVKMKVLRSQIGGLSKTILDAKE